MNHRGTLRGFTLLELLVAVTVTLLLAGLLLSVTTGVLNIWRRSQGGFGTATEARLALDFVERDLQSALERADGATWLAVDVANQPGGPANRGWVTTGARLKPATAASLQLLPDADGDAPRLAEARFGLTGAWLRFFTTNLESGGSLPVAVAYQVVRRPVTGPVTTTHPAPVRYALYRSAVSAPATFASGYDLGAADYVSPANTPGTQRSASTIMNPVTLDALAANVVDFGLWLHVRNSDGSLRRIFPATAGDTTHAVIGRANPADAERMPEIADVLLRILTEEGATLMENIEAGRVTRPPQYASDAEWWWAAASAHSQLFTRRILIRGAAR